MNDTKDQSRDNPPRSSDYDWDLDRNELAAELMQLYDVKEAKRIVSTVPRDVELLDLVKHGENLRDFLGGVKFKPDVDWSKVDCALPVIVASNPDGKVPIDGRHRLKKALDSGDKTIPAIFLTLEETAAVKMIKKDG